MRAYAKEYQQHMELYKLDIDEYVKCADFLSAIIVLLQTVTIWYDWTYLLN